MLNIVDTMKMPVLPVKVYYYHHFIYLLDYRVITMQLYL